MRLSRRKFRFQGTGPIISSRPSRVTAAPMATLIAAPDRIASNSGRGHTGEVWRPRRWPQRPPWPPSSGDGDEPGSSERVGSKRLGDSGGLYSGRQPGADSEHGQPRSRAEIEITLYFAHQEPVGPYPHDRADASRCGAGPATTVRTELSGQETIHHIRRVALQRGHHVGVRVQR